MNPNATAADAGLDAAADVDLVQILERLEWSPKERLQYLVDMLAFEERARRARPVDELS